MKTTDRIGWIDWLKEVGPAFTDRRKARAKEIDQSIAEHLATIRRLRKDAKRLLAEAHQAALVEWTEAEVKEAMDAHSQHCNSETAHRDRR